MRMNVCLFLAHPMRFAQVEHRGSCIQSTFDSFLVPIKNDATLLSSDASYAAPSLPQQWRPLDHAVHQHSMGGGGKNHSMF